MRKIITIGLVCLIFGIVKNAEADYSFKVIVKYPFASEHYAYDTLGNVVVTKDSLVRLRPIKAIIFRSEKDSVYKESITNDSGYVIFTFDEWRDKTAIVYEDIIRMTIDFPNTDRVIRVGDKITFEHLKYSDIDFRKTPGEIEIILPMTVYQDGFKIGDSTAFLVSRFAIMNDMHIGEDYDDFGMAGWNDYEIPSQSNWAIENNKNIVAAINNIYPPVHFVVVLGDITQSSEWSEYQRAKKNS